MIRPAAMAQAPRTRLRTTILNGGSPVTQAANQPVNPSARSTGTKASSLRSRVGSHQMAASGTAAPQADGEGTPEPRRASGKGDGRADTTLDDGGRRRQGLVVRTVQQSD